MTEFDLREAVAEVIKVQKDKVSAGNLRVVTRFDGFQGDTRVRTDQMRLQQVLLNYQSNALKFSPDGGTVTIACSIDRPNRRLEISVTDEGIGISEEDQEKLFKLFGYIK